jgi:hypothetical protein
MKPLDGYTNHDCHLHSKHVDVAWDLNSLPWPWQDDSAEEVQAQDVVEHLNDFLAFFDECHRILAPGGHVHVRLPRFDSPNVYLDPTHRRGYHVHNFNYLDPDTPQGASKGKAYTDRQWRIVQVTDGPDIVAVLEVRK